MSTETLWHRCVCFIFIGRKRVARYASVPGKSVDEALRRFRINYPAPKYFGHRCETTDKATIK
jgi:hypothetical protein